MVEKLTIDDLSAIAEARANKQNRSKVKTFFLSFVVLFITAIVVGKVFHNEWYSVALILGTTLPVAYVYSKIHSRVSQKILGELKIAFKGLIEEDSSVCKIGHKEGKRY